MTDPLTLEARRVKQVTAIADDCRILAALIRLGDLNQAADVAAGIVKLGSTLHADLWRGARKHR